MRRALGRVASPAWTGQAGETAVRVPTAGMTALAVEQAVAGQAHDYLLHHTRLRPSSVQLALAVQVVVGGVEEMPAEVTLSREEVIAAARAAGQRLREVDDGDADKG